MKSFKDYLKGMSGRESELPEDNMSADGIAPCVGSVSDSPDDSSVFCFSSPWADVEGTADGVDFVFRIFVPVVAVSVVFHFLLYTCGPL